MTTPTVRFDAATTHWVISDEERWGDGAYSLVIKRADMERASATDLARALRESRRQELEPDSVVVDLALDDEYSPKSTVVDKHHFLLTAEGRLAVHVSLSSDEHVDSNEAFAARVVPLLAPLLARHRAQLSAVECDGDRDTAPYFHSVEFIVNTQGKTLRVLWDIAEQIEALYSAAAEGTLSPTTTVDLLLGGRADVLIGHSEGPWLDVKAQHYDLTTDRGRIAISQAVSRFCNAEEGGVVVVGMDTKRFPGGEVIKSVRPVRVDGAIRRRYRHALEMPVFPFPFGLRVETANTDAGAGLVVIHVPPQEEELKPFLVHGALVDGRVEGAFISIVRRSGEDSIPITAQQIHGSLAAGRALLRRGELPG